MMSEDTVFLVGESRTNQDNAVTKMYGAFFIVFEVLPETGEIVDVDCSLTLDLSKDFVRRMFLNRRIDEEEALDAQIKRRYFGSSSKAILVAYHDALKRYQKLKERGLEQ